MARLPPMWERGARSGELGAGAKYLQEMAARLRGNPDSEDLEAVARMLEQAAAAGAKGAAAALLLGGRPGRPGMPYEEKWSIYLAVEEAAASSIEAACIEVARSRAREARKQARERTRRIAAGDGDCESKPAVACSPSRIEAIWREVRQGIDEARAIGDAEEDLDDYEDWAIDDWGGYEAPDSSQD